MTPCQNGHTSGRAPSGKCRACAVEQNRKWRQSHKAHQSATDRRRYILKTKRVRNERSRLWALANPERAREHRRKSKAKYRGVNFWVEAAKESV